MNAHGVQLVLVDIRSIHNVASMFRTADGAGVSAIHLVGATPGPTDRFGRLRKDFIKVSLGSEQSISFFTHADFAPVAQMLRSEGYTLVALEQTSKSVDYRMALCKQPVALIVGTEVSGIPEKIIEQCDVVIEIPMRGRKESLNVSVAAGIALYHLTKDLD